MFQLFNAIAILLGIGMLSEPLAFAYAGWIGGTCLIIFYGYITCYTYVCLFPHPRARNNATLGPRFWHASSSKTPSYGHIPILVERHLDRVRVHLSVPFSVLSCLLSGRRKYYHSALQLIRTVQCCIGNTVRGFFPLSSTGVLCQHLQDFWFIDVRSALLSLSSGHSSSS